jgi:hypothetical protein
MEFNVHKNYFKGGGESQWGALYYVNFWALLPNFEAYDKKKNHYEFVERLGWGRKLYFRMHLRNVSRNSVTAIIDHNKGESGGFRFSGRLGEPDEQKYGLEIYYTNKKSPDDYLYRSNGKTTVYISCGSKVMNVPSPHCKMMWDESDKVYADATFSKDYLPQWREILTNIKKVYSGLIIEGE